MAYRMTLIDLLPNGEQVRMGVRSNGDIDLSIGEETIFIPPTVAEEIAKYILREVR